MTKKEAVIQAYEKSSGHISGTIVLAAIAVHASELCGEKVSLEEACMIISEQERKKP